MDEIRHSKARACVVWLVGQYAADDSPGAVVEGVAPWAPDVLRKVAKSFREETIAVKLQAITLAAKLLVLSPSHATLTQLGKYVFALARYDRNYDVRDRGRMLQQLLAGVVPGIGAADARDVGGVVLRRAQVRIVLFEGKESAVLEHAHADSRERLGTFGLVLGRDMPPAHARILPDWLEHGVESSLRDSPDEFVTPTQPITAIGHVAPAALRPGTMTAGRSSPIVLTPAGSGGPSPVGSVPNRAGWTNLDKFYASESEEDDDDDDDDDDEEGEGEGEEEEGTEGSDDEDEESGHQSEGDNDPGGSPPRTPEEDSDADEGSSSRKAPLR
jgi:AP-3 complex subunit beta